MVKGKGRLVCALYVIIGKSCISTLSDGHRYIASLFILTLFRAVFFVPYACLQRVDLLHGRGCWYCFRCKRGEKRGGGEEASGCTLFGLGVLLLF